MKLLMLSIVLMIFVASSVSAQGYYRQKNRDQGWELALLIKDQTAETVEGPNKSEVDFASTTGWGFSVGYNFDKHWNLAFEASHTDPKYKATFDDEEGISRSISHRSDFFTGMFNLTYHILPGYKFSFMPANIEPFVVGGIGWATVDSNVSDGNSYCRPGYYWGWYCQNSSYSETEFSYSAGVGVKTSLSKDMFIRTSYGRQWIDAGKGSSDPEFDIFKLEFGFKYF